MITIRFLITSHVGLPGFMTGWAPLQPLKIGLEKTYSWIKNQVNVA
jgi:hypothetical protein